MVAGGDLRRDGAAPERGEGRGKRNGGPRLTPGRRRRRERRPKRREAAARLGSTRTAAFRRSAGETNGWTRSTRTRRSRRRRCRSGRRSGATTAANRSSAATAEREDDGASSILTGRESGKAGDSIPQAILDGSDETNHFETSSTEKDFNSGLTSARGGAAPTCGPHWSAAQGEREGYWQAGPTGQWHKAGGARLVARLGFKPAGRLWRGRRRARTVASDGNRRREAAADGAKTAAAAEAAARATLAAALHGGRRGKGRERKRGRPILTEGLGRREGGATANGNDERREYDGDRLREDLERRLGGVREREAVHGARHNRSKAAAMVEAHRSARRCELRRWNWTGEQRTRWTSGWRTRRCRWRGAAATLATARGGRSGGDGGGGWVHGARAIGSSGADGERGKKVERGAVVGYIEVGRPDVAGSGGSAATTWRAGYAAAWAVVSTAVGAGVGGRRLGKGLTEAAPTATNRLHPLVDIVMVST
uniref:Uncharacterized protein n=1 Tax=Oryza sativa subsp. japonica TaxID=39947 RepID=Q75HF1_ORYSJ|nr:hypothetical protein [Oryza sativa Japonica Group]